MAPPVTAAAADGDAFARTICDDAVTEVLTRIRLAGGFLDAPVAVATAGSVLRSEYVTAELRQQVGDVDGYRAVEPTPSPVAGAVFDAIDRVAGADDAVVGELKTHAIGRA